MRKPRRPSTPVIASQAAYELSTASDWTEESIYGPLPRLVELRVFAPPRNYTNTPELIPVEITLDITACRQEIGNVPVLIALTDAELHADCVGCAPYRDSRAGERDNPREDVAVRAGVWSIAAPVNQAGYLDGNLFRDKPLLMNVLLQGTGEESVTVRLTSPKRSLIVIPEDHTLNASILKDQLRQDLLLAPSSRDGHIEWAAARFRRKQDQGGERR